MGCRRPRRVIMGRPHAFRLPDHLGDRLDAAVAAARISKGDWLRQLICRELNVPFVFEAARRHVSHGAQIDAALDELNAIGRNINQAVRALNVQPHDERGRAAQSALIAMRADIERLTTRIYDLLGVEDVV